MYTCPFKQLSSQPIVFQQHNAKSHPDTAELIKADLYFLLSLHRQDGHLMYHVLWSFGAVEAVQHHVTVYL